GRRCTSAVGPPSATRRPVENQREGPELEWEPPAPPPGGLELVAPPFGAADVPECGALGCCCCCCCCCGAAVDGVPFGETITPPLFVPVPVVPVVPGAPTAGKPLGFV